MPCPSFKKRRHGTGDFKGCPKTPQRIIRRLILSCFIEYMLQYKKADTLHLQTTRSPQAGKKDISHFFLRYDFITDRK